MTNKKIFEFNDYKVFLTYLEQERSHFTRGFRSRLAEAVNCNNAFVSQVLNTSAHFSLEQGVSLCKYLKINSDEQRYFLFLIEYARAGSQEVKEQFQILLDELKEKHLNIKNRVKQQTILTAEAQATYYSQWYFAAIHMIVTLPEYRTLISISKALKLSKNIVEKTVSFLLDNELLIEKNGELFSGPSYLHLDRDSPNIYKHHINWRLAAILALQNEDKTNVHYSTVSTLSKKDVEVLRARLVQQIQDYVQTVSHSTEEVMYCFNLDFFKLIG